MVRNQRWDQSKLMMICTRLVLSQMRTSNRVHFLLLLLLLQLSRGDWDGAPIGWRNKRWRHSYCWVLLNLCPNYYYDIIHFRFKNQVFGFISKIYQLVPARLFIPTWRVLFLRFHSTRRIFWSFCKSLSTTLILTIGFYLTDKYIFSDFSPKNLILIRIRHLFKY